MNGYNQKQKNQHNGLANEFKSYIFIILSSILQTMFGVIQNEAQNIFHTHS